MPDNTESEGGSTATPAVSNLCSAASDNLPVAASTATTSCPSPRNAGITWAALAIETSRSSLVPPNRTAIFIARILAAKIATMYAPLRENARVEG